MNKKFQAGINAGTLTGIVVALVFLLTFGVASNTTAQSKGDLCRKYAHSDWAYNCCMTHNSNNFDECFNSGSSPKSSSSSSSNKSSGSQQSVPQSSGLYTSAQAEAAYQIYFSCLEKNDNNVDICDDDFAYKKIKSNVQENYDKCQNACGQDSQCLTGCDKYKKILDEIAQTKADAGASTGKPPKHNSDSNSKPALAHDFTEEFQSLAGGLARPFDEIYWKAKPFPNTIVTDNFGLAATTGDIQNKGWKKVSPITTEVPLEDVKQGDVVSTQMPEGLPLGKMVFAANDPVKYAKSEITIYDGATTPEILRQTSGPLSNDDVQKPDPKKYDIGFYFRVGTVETQNDEEIHPFSGAMFEILPWMTFDSPQYIRNLRVIRWNRSQQRWDELPITTEQGCDAAVGCRVFAKSPGTSYFAVVAAKQTSWLASLAKIFLWISLVGLVILAGIIFLIISLVRRKGKNRTPANKNMSGMRKGIRVGVMAAAVVILIFLTAAGSIFYFANKYKINNTDSTAQTSQNSARKATGQNPSAIAGNNTLEPQPYTSAKFGFTIHPPKGWTTNESPKSGAMVAFLNPKTDENVFHANINIIGESTQLDLDNYMNTNKKAMAQMDPGYKLIEDEKLTINGIPAELIGGTSKQAQFNLRNMQLYLIKDGKAAIITGTALESTWEEYKDAIRNSLLTFSLN
ncbi:MAG: DcrB-related protein [Candidatus Moranbacteria bacterium]|nr:DcrB-related protein [Candidatus Moranbacteria bacterium]